MHMTKYYKTLNKILDEVFLAAGSRGMSNQEMADKADLHVVTVNRLESRWTEYPRFRTVLNLVHAVGMDLTTVQALKLHRKGA